MSDANPHATHGNRWLVPAAIGIGTFSLIPYILPIFGKGAPIDASNMMHFIGAPVAEGTFGSGIAGSIQNALGALPGIGGALTSTAPVTIPVVGITVASGALVSIALSAGIGIGGALLSRYLEKHEDPNASIRWSKIIRIASLATSALIALPGILGAISVAITFLANLSSTEAGSNAAIFMRNTLGATNIHASAAGGFAAVLSHLISCGVAILPVGLSAYLGIGKPSNAHSEHAGDSSAVELVSASPIIAGQPCQLGFRLRDESGRFIRPEDIQVTHTEKLHTMIVDNTLGEYHHTHPTYDAASGLFTCEFTPRSAQGFTAWHEFTPVGQSAPLQARVEVAPTRGFALKPFVVPTSQSQSGGLSATITATPPLAAGRPSMLRVTLRDANGAPVNALEPVMGAYGHLAGFSSDGQHFIHSHPVTPLGTPLENGTLEFHVAPEQAGLTKFFLQLKRDGQEIILPFGQAIAQGKTFAARASAPATGHAHHAMA